MTVKLRPFRTIPADIVEWTKWMQEQDFEQEEFTGDATFDSVTVGDLTVTGGFEVTDTYWDDMRFPATAVNPPGLASDPDFDTTNGGWLFDSTSTELIFMMAQMPHAWKEESILKPHLHWQKTTSAAGDCYWQLDYKKAPIGEVMDAAFTTLSVTDTVAGTPDNDTANEHLISSFDDITMVGGELSDMLVMKLSRIGGNGADTYGADARLLEFDIHFQINSLGSAEQFEQ